MRVRRTFVCRNIIGKTKAGEPIQCSGGGLWTEADERPFCVKCGGSLTELAPTQVVPLT